MRDRLAARDSLNELPDGVLELIAQHTYFEDRRTVLPLINKRWARVLRGPSLAWRSISMFISGDESLDPTTLLQWFMRRPGCVLEFYIDHCAAHDTLTPVLSAIIGSQFASLQSVYMHIWDRCIGDHHIAGLVACTGLTSLAIDSHKGYESCGEAFLQIANLPGLTHLDLHGWSSCKGDQMVSFQVADVCSPTLRELYFEAWTPVAGHVLRLHLPELRAMELTWCNVNWLGAGDGLALDNETFRKTGKLEVLGFHQLAEAPKLVTLTPQCLAPLKMLKELKLADCGLTGVPPAVAVLSASLTSLSLEHNVDLQLCETDIGTLLELRLLMELDVHKVYEDDPDTAELWSNDSIQLLIDLPGMFMAQHGAVPEVIFYPYRVH